MSKKDDFLKSVEEMAGLDYFREWRTKIDVKGFADYLNAHPIARKLFREAVAEAKEESANPTAGLSTLFPPQE